MVKVITLVACLFVVGGCARWKQLVHKPIQIPTTEIISAECPPPPAYNKPHLPIEGVGLGSTNEEIVRAAVETILILQSENDKLKELLDAYGIDIEKVKEKAKESE